MQAKNWINKYPGSHIVKGYRKKYRVDLITAIKELKELGVALAEDYERILISSINPKKETRAKLNESQMLEFQDSHFSFIAGYTSAGVPYGIAWEDETDHAKAIESDVF